MEKQYDNWFNTVDYTHLDLEKYLNVLNLKHFDHIKENIIKDSLNIFDRTIMIYKEAYIHGPKYRPNIKRLIFKEYFVKERLIFFIRVETHRRNDMIIVIVFDHYNRKLTKIYHVYDTIEFIRCVNNSDIVYIIKIKDQDLVNNILQDLKLQEDYDLDTITKKDY